MWQYQLRHERDVMAQSQVGTRGEGREGGSSGGLQKGRKRSIMSTTFTNDCGSVNHR